MSQKFEGLNLKPRLLERLEKSNLRSCKDVFNFSKFELINMLGLHDKEVEDMILEINKNCAPKSVTTQDMQNNNKKSPNKGFLPTTFPVLDNALHGGIPMGSITEIVGPPSVGKTQFCMLLSILTTLPNSVGGLDGSVIYIDTESTFSAKRLKEMAESKFPYLFTNDGDKYIISLMKKIQIYRPHSIAESKKVLKQVESNVFHNNVKLIIIDSVASLLNKNLGSVDLMSSIVERNNVFTEQAAILKNIAETFQIIVFVTNQITTQIKEKISTPQAIVDEENINLSSLSLEHEHSLQGQNQPEQLKSKVIPCLGNSWAHCVSTRFVAQFTSIYNRQLIIWKSPIAPNLAVRFTITKAGLKLHSNDAEVLKCFDAEAFNIYTKCDFLGSGMSSYLGYN